MHSLCIPSAILKKVILSTKRSCRCGVFESCEICDSFSAYNRLIEARDELIDGPKPKPTLESYGGTFAFNEQEIIGDLDAT